MSNFQQKWSIRSTIYTRPETNKNQFGEDIASNAGFSLLGRKSLTDILSGARIAK